MAAIRLFLSLCFLTGLVAAEGRYQRVDPADFIDNPEAYQGQLVEVTAEVVSVNADAKALRLFDAQSKALIGVSLTQLEKAQRRALLLNPVHRLSVLGQVVMSEGKAVIDAHQVVTFSDEMITGSRRSAGEGNEGHTVSTGKW
jgi:hypothetical protein